MVDDAKHSEALKVWLTEREYLDLCRQAAREDRKPGELARVILRRYLYGVACDGVTKANRADEGQTV